MYLQLLTTDIFYRCRLALMLKLAYFCGVNLGIYAFTGNEKNFCIFAVMNLLLVLNII